MTAELHRDDADIPEVTLVFDDEDAQGSPTFTQSPRGRSGHRQRAGRPRRRMWRADPSQSSTHRLPELGVSTGILAGALIAISVLGIVVVNIAGAITMAGVTTTLALGSAILPEWLATVGSTLFGTFGATLVTMAIFAAFMVRSRTGRGPAFLVTMGAAWMLSGLVATVTIGSTPYLFSALSFVAALACALTLVTPTPFRPFAAVTGTLLVLAFGTSVVYVGTTTAVGAVASILVGAIGVALGAVVWNRWWAPILEARERMAAAMAGGWTQGVPRP